MKVDTDPLQVAETSLCEPFECLMLEAIEVTPVQSISVKKYAEKVKADYPREEEDLINFLNRCKLHNKEIMLCPRCSAVCDKEADVGLQNYMPHVSNNNKWPNARP
ncbi:hypothetical protein A2U01_0062468, partial [Trifolium medium]|nr:hypothetical protein [Trifolium medium]